MKLGFVYCLVYIVCVVLSCSSSFAQPKKIIMQSVIEEVVYEYDTIFLEDVKQEVLTFHVMKPKSALLLVAESKMVTPILVRPTISKLADSVNFFIALSGSAFSTFSTVSNNRANGLSVKQYGSCFPAYSLTFGVVKQNVVYSLSAEYRQYSEVLQQAIPLSWKDTIDNGNEIYYRNIDGQQKAVIKNQYHFLQVNSEIGYRFGFSSFSIIPQVLIGIGMNLPLKNYYLNTLSQTVEAVNSGNKVGTFFVLGASCPLMYHYNNRIAFLLKPEWQHFFIGTTIHPLQYRNILGLNLGIVYSFSTHY